MRKGFLKSVLAGLLTSLVVASSFAAGERKPGERRTVAASAPRLALVIGNAKYPKLGALDNPGRDAALMAERLGQLGFEVTAVADRDLKTMTSDVEEFSRKVKQRGPQTVSLLYYAGHGVENDSINYLVPVNADIKKRADIIAFLRSKSDSPAPLPAEGEVAPPAAEAPAAPAEAAPPAEAPAAEPAAPAPEAAPSAETPPAETAPPAEAPAAEPAAPAEPAPPAEAPAAAETEPAPSEPSVGEPPSPNQPQPVYPDGPPQ